MLGRGPKVVNAELRSDAGTKPKSGAELDAVNAGAEPDAGPEPDAYSGCLLVGDFLQWKKETMKEHELFAIPMKGCREANWPGRRRASTPRDMH
ncbi:hypothetical protein CDL15_Pgr018392 [Punica granatum]|uniref:Uncharacterized protein n=1 Tax=Punica granatum TaxID=22663 RepID=A0A218W2X6_PUNGR|nr:hypothetical protein CDL15_Pgr018392 [Punica granatum]